MSGGALEVECIADAARFRSLRDEWSALHARIADATPFSSWEWLYSWWQAYGMRRQLQLVTMRSRGALVALAPLYAQAEPIAAGVDARVLRLVGDGSFDSDYLGFVVAPEAADATARAFGEWLSANRDWDALSLRDLVGDSALPAIAAAFAKGSGAHYRHEHGRCGVVDLPPSFDQFLRERQSRFRTRIRALLKRIDDGDVVFDDRCDAAQLRSRLRSLYALHQARWTDAGGPGVFGERARRRFYAHFAPRFARRGWLRLYSLRRGSAWVAHQLCFGFDGTTYLLQEGFDATDGAASYGQMLRAAVMRSLIERGERRYDFLGGFSQHKASWGAREAASAHAIVARRRWRGTLYFKLPIWRERVGATAHRALPAPLVQALRRAATVVSAPRRVP